MLNFLYNLATDRHRGLGAGLIKFFLYILCLVYGIMVRILIFLYSLKPYRLNCKVISVGNITLGGSGKTPLVEFIAEYLKQEGRRLAILSRGYKRKPVDSRLSTADCKTMGDEPYMLYKNLKDIPVLVDADRIRAAKAAINEYGADTVILDDGFQQWKIRKDLEVVAIDATDPFGNRHLLPRGILRQPVSTLKMAHVLVITKTNLQPDIQDLRSFLEEINPDGLIVEAAHKPMGLYRIDDTSKSLISPDTLKTKPVSLVSGIADPDSFEGIIQSLGINIGLFFKFPDHHNYTCQEIERIILDSKNKGIDAIITTEKDAVRIDSVLHPPQSVGARFLPCAFDFYVLRIKIEIEQNDLFLQRIHSLYNR